MFSLEFISGLRAGHYLGVKHRMEDTILFAEGDLREKPRGISN